MRNDGIILVVGPAESKVTCVLLVKGAPRPHKSQYRKILEVKGKVRGN